MLIVLFATSMVLKSFSGLLCNFMTVLNFLSFSDLNLSISSGLKEKKATSEAETKAEPIKRIMIIRKPKTILKSGALMPIPDNRNIYDRGLSVSNLVSVNKTI
jgi:hypothetical protein